ncbi:hypothetical protein SELMODRAFT_137727 (mitochondrion) [Selaginella moellendorffii]|uniref:Photosystem II cytochrome b559 N-terminal domain-containing protein n=3 Tax=Selaginella moellendorffii TaxID=88036 RepID=D8TE91_SELML|nr:hypothetical protein SELMODRAFT_137727 [Selaginella moellendorffii]
MTIDRTHPIPTARWPAIHGPAVPTVSLLGSIPAMQSTQRRILSGARSYDTTESERTK